MTIPGVALMAFFALASLWSIRKRGQLRRQYRDWDARRRVEFDNMHERKGFWA